MKLSKTIFCTLFIIASFLISSNGFCSENKLTLLFKGADNDCYYDKASIIGIGEGNVGEGIVGVAFSCIDSAGRTTMTNIRIDCVNKKYATGRIFGWKRGAQEPTALYDFNKNGCFRSF